MDSTKYHLPIEWSYPIFGLFLEPVGSRPEGGYPDPIIWPVGSPKSYKKVESEGDSLCQNRNV